MTNKVTVHAPAKVNLFLQVVGRNADDYHLLQSMVMFADYGDDITVEASDIFSLNINGRHFDDSNNSVIKAAHALSTALNIPPNIAITLNKNIPIGAGLGGGSSDAAATMKALLQFWDTSFERNELDTLLLSLGADVPSCYHATACYFEGIGERITPLTLSAPLHAVLINPEQSCSTQKIFKNYSSEFSDPVDLPTRFTTCEEVIEFLQNQKNDLTAPAIRTLPIIKDILEILETHKPLLSRMSGSGATCFAIFKSNEEATHCALTLRKTHPTFWVEAVSLR